MTDIKQYTLEELKEKLIEEFFNPNVKLDYDRICMPDIPFIEVLSSVKKIIEDLGIKVRE